MRPSLALRRRVALAFVALASFAAASGTAPAGSRSRWASFETAKIRPGAETVTAGSQCTANFVFASEDRVYLGQAAHCASRGEATETNGCEADALPLGTRVRIEGARDRGVLVYSSWVTMQRERERDLELCEHNDFALIRLSAYDAARVNPSVPVWGGPTGLAPLPRLGDEVVSYGNSWLWLGIDPLQPHRGLVVGRTSGGRGVEVVTAPPGVPGDSGSAYLDGSGRALGVLSTLQLLPRPGTNIVASLPHALRYLHRHTTLRVRLVPGTEPFSLSRP